METKYNLKGFSKLKLEERLEKLIEVGALSREDVNYLCGGGVQSVKLAEHLIENVIGYFQMPLGVATNFCIDGVDKIIPMAVEETSIVAAASKTARFVREHGRIETRTFGRHIIGQIQIAKVKNKEFAKVQIEKHTHEWVALANRVAEGLVRRGGGVEDLMVREVARGDGGEMLVIHVLADPCDAMGANIINQVCEALKLPIEQATNEKITMCILSNLVDTKLTEAKVILENIDPELANAIAEASLFAKVDPYRAATNNKGVLNGMDAVILATGNDWRAVEAGVHAYAARSGQYRSITEWQAEGSTLVGRLLAPIIVGTVGGVTRVHPTAKICLSMLNVESAEELSRVVAAVGLVQNLGALKALSTVGIVEGHMRLHTANLALAAGASADEAPLLQEQLSELLKREKKVSLSDAQEILKKLRRVSHYSAQ